MSLIMRGTELIGRPIVTLDGAVDIAEVRDVIFDPGASVVVGFALRGRGALAAPDAGVLPMARVSAIGRNAIMVAEAASVGEPDAVLESAEGTRRDVVGDEVVTEAGHQIGRVVDLILRVGGSRAEVVGYELLAPDGGRSLIPMHATVSVSGETLIVSNAVERYLSDDLTGFGAAVERLRPGDGGQS